MLQIKGGKDEFISKQVAGFQHHCQISKAIVRLLENADSFTVNSTVPK
jgi:hypothetical protein